MARRSALIFQTAYALLPFMLHYIIRRLLIAIPTLFAVITATFFIMRFTPGGPFDFEAALPPEIEANIRAAYNLDKSLPAQFGDYLINLAQGDFGPSFKSKDFSVTELIAQGLPITVRNGILALILAVVLGATLGMAAALKQNSAGDYTVMGFAMVGIVIPSFVIAPLLMLVFGVYGRGHWWELPISGADGKLSSMVLPIFCLSLPFIAYVARIMRASLIETLRSNFIRTARAKGVPERTILLRHALKPAMMPVVTFLGPATVALLTGSVVIEKIFSIPGIGRYFVDGAINRDYNLVMGVTVLGAALMILMNLIVDLLYGLLDPKVRYE